LIEPDRRNLRGFTMERQEKKEKVLVPIRRQQEAIPEQEPLKEIPEDAVIRPIEMPRRWYTF
jgi:hypothetical protein